MNIMHFVMAFYNKIQKECKRKKICGWNNFDAWTFGCKKRGSHVYNETTEK